MSILSNILHKIFPQHKAAASTNVAPAQVPPLASEAGAANITAATTAGAGQVGASAGATNTAQSPFPPFTNQPSPAAISEVDVEAILNNMAKTSGQPLNWRSSIVDLLKLLNLDSSLQARKELAAELHYTGNTEDSAAMNIWLHRQVMNKLAANGGKVPAELRD
jgi:hypothetical protein